MYLISSFPYIFKTVIRFVHFFKSNASLRLSWENIFPAQLPAGDKLLNSTIMSPGRRKNERENKKYSLELNESSRIQESEVAYTTELKSVHWILEVRIFSVYAGQKLAYLKEATN